MGKRGREKTGSTEWQQKVIDRISNDAEKIYAELQEYNPEILTATLEQIVYCIHFGVQLTKTDIYNFLTCKSVIQVENKARKLKLAC